MPIELCRISADQLQALSGASTVFFFPVGPLEDHGPHLPLDLDVREAQALCRLAAERLEREKPGWTGVIMPSAPLGASANTARVALTVRAFVLRDWLIDASRSLMRSGFRYFVCFSGNLGPRQVTAIEEASKSISWQGPFTTLRRLLAPAGSNASIKPIFISASSALTSAKDMARSPLWPDPEEHGTRRDTSVALHLGALVQPESPLPTEKHAPLSSRRARVIQRLTRKLQGYWGMSTPEQATSELGESTLQGSLDEIFPKLRAVLEGGRAGSLFRSWYSILPPNQSYFKAWLLFVMVLGVLLAWVLFTTQSVVSRI